MISTYDILVHKTGIERHTVDADSHDHAYDLYLEGKATLKDDETSEVSSIDVVDRLTNELKGMAE